jgi:hypothetical protein
VIGADTTPIVVERSFGSVTHLSIHDACHS